MSTSAPSRPRTRPTSRPIIEIDFERGDPVAIDGETLSPASLLARLNQLGHDNGIGRLDLVENRFVGMKSRGVYETPGGTILLAAHRGIESITLDRGAMHLKDELMPRYAELIYNGFWFSPEREMLQALIDKSQEHVDGTVRLKLYKGNVIVIGRESPKSLYDQELVTFEDDAGAYDQRDAAGLPPQRPAAEDRGAVGAAAELAQLGVPPRPGMSDRILTTPHPADRAAPRPSGVLMRRHISLLAAFAPTAPAAAEFAESARRRPPSRAGTPPSSSSRSSA